jgi:hypothetical protein
MSLALPSIIQVGDTEFIHAKLDAVALMTSGSQCEHMLFLTPNDDHHFMIFTVDNYSGPVADFFDRLQKMRGKETPKQDVKSYDRRPFMPFKGNIRQEDLMTQGTQGVLGERRERLGAADRGVIKFRKIVVDAIRNARKGGTPKGVLLKHRAGDVIRLDTSVGVRRAKGRPRRRVSSSLRSPQ